MKNFIKKYGLKIFGCMALVCAVIFSAVKPVSTKNDHIKNAEAVEQNTYIDVSNLLAGEVADESYYNLMDDYPLTPENQTTSGLCWAYSSLKAIESALMIQKGEYYNFSEVALAYMAYYQGGYTIKDPGDKNVDPTNPYDVGSNFTVVEATARNYGLVNESDFSNDKYFDINEANHENYAYVTDFASKEIMSYCSTVWLYQDTDFSGADYEDRAVMVKKFIKNYGGLFAGIEEGYIYLDGADWIYTQEKKEATRYSVGGSHAICLVGWGADGYIALNSWGTEVFEFYIPYDYEFMHKTLEGVVCTGDSKVSFERDSQNKFEELTQYKALDNVYCIGEDVEFDLAFDNTINFENVLVEIFKGTQEVTNIAFDINYDDASKTANIEFKPNELSFDGGVYVVRVYEGETLLSQKCIMIVSGTEVSYFLLEIDNNNQTRDSELFMNSYVSSDDSVTYYVRPSASYFLNFYLTEINKYDNTGKRLNASVGTPNVISVENGVEVTDIASAMSVTLDLSVAKDNANEYQIKIKYFNSYAGKVIRFPLTVSSNINGITASRTYYINLIVSSMNTTEHLKNTSSAYAIEYMLDGGINSSENIDRVPVYADENTMTEFLLKTPTKDGKMFIGWFLDKDYTIEITKIDASITSDIVIYAKWQTVDVDYFDFVAAISKITSYAGADKALTDPIVYGDDVLFEIDFIPTNELKAYNYSVRYKVFINGTEFDAKQIDKLLLKASVELLFANAGVYQMKIVVNVVVSHNMSIQEEQTINFEIEKKEVEFEFSNLEHGYDGKLHKPVVSIKNGFVYEEDLAKISKLEDFYVISEGAKKDAGTYEYVILSLTNHNYKVADNQKCTMVISQKELTFGWSNFTKTYNGKAQFPSYNLEGVVAGDAVSINMNCDNMIDVGEYDIHATLDENKNYYVANIGEIRFVIKPAQIVIKIANVSDRATTAPIYRKQVEYEIIAGKIYSPDKLDDLNIQLHCKAKDVGENVETYEKGKYPITITYSHKNYIVKANEAFYTLTGSYKVYYTLPNGNVVTEEVTEGENPVGLDDDDYKIKLFEKFVYSEELKDKGGEDLHVVVTVKDYTWYVLGGAAVVVVFMIYLWVTRKSRRNRVR